MQLLLIQALFGVVHCGEFAFHLLKQTFDSGRLITDSSSVYLPVSLAFTTVTLRHVQSLTKKYSFS